MFQQLFPHNLMISQRSDAARPLLDCISSDSSVYCNGWAMTSDRFQHKDVSYLPETSRNYLFDEHAVDRACLNGQRQRLICIWMTNPSDEADHLYELITVDTNSSLCFHHQRLKIKSALTEQTFYKVTFWEGEELKKMIHWSVPKWTVTVIKDG